MQSSSMMLDSTIAGALTAKQVEPSTQIDSVSVPKTDDSTSNSSSSEAEVRLVVRFIVEEHIVYKGKVKKVHQLENEELSRIVSHVAWDGAKENDNLNMDRDNDARVENESSIEPTKPEQHGFRKVIDTMNESTVTNVPMVMYNPTEVESEDQAQEKTTRNNDSSNLEAYIKFSPDSIEDIPEIEENSVAQTEVKPIVESKSATNCDNNLERSSNHICETDKRCSPDSPPAKQIYTQDLTDNFVIDLVMKNNGDYGLNSNPTPESIDDVCADSQSISDTLNDCVNNVDLECQREGNETVQAIESKAQDFELTSPRNPNEHNEPSDTKENGKDMSESESVKVETNNSNENIHDKNQKLFPALDDCSHEEIVRSIDATCDLNNVLPREVATNSSIKRKTTGDHQNSTGKRIRRANSKDPNHNTRTSASKSSENSSAKHHSTTPRLNSTGSLLPNNQQTRKVKVFAKWSDNHFYPGTILRPAKDCHRKFVIDFFDGAQRNVAETDLIPICNIEGKQVRISIAKNYCVNAIVHDQRSLVIDQPMFDVEYQQDGLVRKCVPLKDIFLTAEQATPLINQQVEKNTTAGNFADVDLDNIIYEKRSRRLQEMEEFYFTSSSPHRTKTSLLL